MLDKIPREELKTRLGLEMDIAEAMRQFRFRWYGQVVRKKEGEGVKNCMNMAVEATSIRGCP